MTTQREVLTMICLFNGEETLKSQKARRLMLKLHLFYTCLFYFTVFVFQCNVSQNKQAIIVYSSVIMFVILVIGVSGKVRLLVHDIDLILNLPRYAVVVMLTEKIQEPLAGAYVLFQSVIPVFGVNNLALHICKFGGAKHLVLPTLAQNGTKKNPTKLTR